MAFSTDFAAAGLDVAGGTTSPSPPTACSPVDAPMTGGGASAVEPMSGDTAGDEPEVHRRLRPGPLGPLRLVLRRWKPSLQPPRNRDCLDGAAGEAQPFSTPTSSPPPLLVGPPLRRRPWGHQSILDSVPFRKVPLPACVPQGRSPGKGPLLWASQPVLGAASLPQGVFGVFVKGVPGDVDRVHRQAVVQRRTECLANLAGASAAPLQRQRRGEQY